MWCRPFLLSGNEGRSRRNGTSPFPAVLTSCARVTVLAAVISELQMQFYFEGHLDLGSSDP